MINKWNSNSEVIGIPSGQIIYMNTRQINYFKNKNKIKFTMWNKQKNRYPLTELKKYCFDDTDYDDIMEILNDI